MCVFRKHLPQLVADMGKVWQRWSQVVKGLECQVKESEHCSQATREPQKGFEQGKEGSDLIASCCVKRCEPEGARVGEVGSWRGGWWMRHSESQEAVGEGCELSRTRSRALAYVNGGMVPETGMDRSSLGKRMLRSDEKI